jgi:hypothetical protein
VVKPVLRFLCGAVVAYSRCKHLSGIMPVRTRHILFISTRKPDGIAGAPPAARVFLESPTLNQIEYVAVGGVL